MIAGHHDHVEIGGELEYPVELRKRIVKVGYEEETNERMPKRLRRPIGKAASHAIECIPKLEHALPILASANGKISTASRSRLQSIADMDIGSLPNAHAKPKRFTDTPGMLFGIFFPL